MQTMGSLNDPERPMKIYQSSSNTFFGSYQDFDSSVICIGFVDRSAA